MVARAIARSFVLNAFAAASGLAATLYITWSLGLSEFAYYTINFAKLSLIMVGAELLPSSFTLFRLQEDSDFDAAVPVFYLFIAIAGATAAAGLIALGLVSHQSWFMVAFVFGAVVQRYFDTQAQACGKVDAYFWIPATTNVTRLVLLAGLSQFHSMSAADLLWLSVAAATFVGQAVMVSRFPEFLEPASYRRPFSKLHYLWSMRAAYYDYYPNSVLKRLRDTFLPVFCDLVVPSKVEIGRLLVFTRANEAVCGQVRVLEAFMVNRASRSHIRDSRRRIFLIIAPIGQFCVAAVALALMYRHGIGIVDVALALATGLFIYPYILELYWRNDALAAFAPKRVTTSLLSFLVVLALPPIVALAFGRVSIVVFILSYVCAQIAAAATYKVLGGSAPISPNAG